MVTLKPTSVSLRLVAISFSVALSVWSAFGQKDQIAPAFLGTREFPVLMLQSVAAGKTPVGTKVQAKLQIATLVNGIVFPRDAILAGEVVKSDKKSADAPSRLAIRIDSVQSKNASAAIKVYLTEWYYPTSVEAGQNLQYGPSVPANRTWNGQGAYPNPNSPSYKPFPGSDSDADKSSVPNTGAAKTSDHPVQLRDMEAVRAEDGTLELVCKRTTIKLDKLTTYVFSGDLMPKK